MMNETVTLELDQLDGAGIRLSYGLTAARAKESRLLATLAKVLKQEYDARTGKLPSDTTIDARIDLEEYAPEELQNAFGHFSCLAAAFQSNNHKSSARFCLAIMESISSALESVQGAAHA